MNSFFLLGILSLLLSLGRLLVVSEGAQGGAATWRSEDLAAVPSLGVDPLVHHGGVGHCLEEEMVIKMYRVQSMVCFDEINLNIFLFRE